MSKVPEHISKKFQSFILSSSSDPPPSQQPDSESSSSNTSQSFSQWRFPLPNSPISHHSHPPPPPPPESDPSPPQTHCHSYPQPPPSELFHLAELQLTSDSDSDRLNALHMLERWLVSNPPTDAAAVDGGDEVQFLFRPLRRLATLLCIRGLKTFLESTWQTATKLQHPNWDPTPPKLQGCGLSWSSCPKNFSNFSGFNPEKFEFSLDSTQRKFKFLWIHFDRFLSRRARGSNSKLPLVDPTLAKLQGDVEASLSWCPGVF